MQIKQENEKKVGQTMQEGISYSRINQAVEHILTTTYKPGELLELGSGEGGLAARLHQLGYRVTPTDYDPEGFLVPGMTCSRIDLDEAIPFPENKFDYVIGVEVIEHLENHFFFIRECCRVLKPGGILILTTPNLLSMASRIKYFWTGFYPLCQRPNDEFQKIRLYQHINPVNYYNLRYILHTNNLQIQSITTDRYRKSSIAFIILYPLFSLLTRMTMKGEPSDRQAKVNRVIRKVLLSPALLLGRTMIVTAKKGE